MAENRRMIHNLIFLSCVTNGLDHAIRVKLNLEPVLRYGLPRVFWSNKKITVGSESGTTGGISSGIVTGIAIRQINKDSQILEVRLPFANTRHVKADGVRFLIDRTRQTQKITKPTSAAQMIDYSLLEEVL